MDLYPPTISVVIVISTYSLVITRYIGIYVTRVNEWRCYLYIHVITGVGEWVNQVQGTLPCLGPRIRRRWVAPFHITVFLFFIAYVHEKLLVIPCNLMSLVYCWYTTLLESWQRQWEAYEWSRAAAGRFTVPVTGVGKKKNVYCQIGSSYMPPLCKGTISKSYCRDYESNKYLHIV